ncbi:MAG: AbrB/MazE/SpoVT family DNA-binding domain-containing protein [Acidobacteria bacterium]|nr:AbrB/MazE/SpoVT family DNA-binding domain-containing protein [Acidobacteriota bacterium]
MIVTKLTEKYQTTIPAEVRQVLELSKGDSVVFEIDNGRVTVRKALPMDMKYLRSLESALCEWMSEHDRDAYRGL